MIINEKINEVFTNTNESKSFTIEASAAAFKILSSQIYENKIKAVIRELCANAYDSHVWDNKKNIPFEVHLPNSFEPFLSVQDFGVGMSEDDIMNVYTSYFKSLKTHTNDVIGGLGLGSKSPFCLVDQFTVVSTFEGIRSTYNAFIGTDGSPQITKVNSTRTTAENGVIVKLPVKPDDFNRFAIEANSVLRWFKTIPNITGRTAKVESIRQDKEYYCVDISPGSHSFFAVMGNVAYPVDFDSHDLEFLFEKINGYLAVEFDIGDLEVSASRETLSLTKDTQAKIKSKLDGILGEIVEEMQKSIDALEHLRDIKSLDYWSYIQKNLKQFTYKGKTIDQYSKSARYTDDDRPMFHTLFRHYHRKNVRHDKWYSVVANPWTNRKTMCLVIDKNRYVQHNRNEFYNEHRTMNSCDVIECNLEDLEGVKDFFEYVDFDYELLSKRIENGCKPERKKLARGTVAGIKITEITSDESPDEYKDTLKNLKDSIENDTRTVHVVSVDYRSNGHKEVINLISQCIKDDTVVYAVNDSACAELLKLDDVSSATQMDISDDMIKSIEEYIDLKPYSSAAYDVSWRMTGKRGGEIETLIGVSNDLTENYLKMIRTKSTEFLSGSKVDQMIREFDHLKKYEKLIDNHSVTVHDIKRRLDELEKWFNNRYPLIRFTEVINLDNSKDDHLKLYIEAVNKQLEEETDD